MLNELKFAMGAVSKKDFIPALTHFKIQDSTIRSFNGTLALCCPIELDINCTPEATPLIKAIQNCKDTVSLNLTPTGKLSIKSGPFRALINCIEGETPHALPEGEFFSIDGENLLKSLKTLLPFVGDDASRPWCNGILLKGLSAFATNNVIAIEYWVGSEFPLTCNLPRQTVQEMIRINEVPLQAQATEKNITFHYSGNRWIKSQLLETQWPDINRLLDRQCSLRPIDENIFNGLETLKPFCDKFGRVFFKPGVMTTHSCQSEGATFEIESINFDAIYRLEMFASLKGVAQEIDLSFYPEPAIFTGERLRGAIVGMTVL